MTAVYGISLLIGAFALLVWIAATAVAHTVDGWDRIEPQERFGAVGRLVLGGVVGFGMAGMSASFGGWSPLLSFVGAVAGAAGLIAVAFWLGPEETP